MDFNDKVPILILHVLKANISQDPSIIDEDIYPAERLNGRLDNFLSVFDAVIIGHSLSASSSDFVNDYIGGLLSRSGS